MFIHIGDDIAQGINPSIKDNFIVHQTDVASSLAHLDYKHTYAS